MRSGVGRSPGEVLAMTCLRKARVPGSPRTRWALVASALVAVAVVFASEPVTSTAADPVAPAPFRGDAEVQLRGSVHAAFPEPAAGPHRYTFFATAGTKV